MAHPNTERLIDYWRARRGPRAAPTRAAIDPADFAELMAQVFIAGRMGLGQYPLRLAGGFVADLHGRDLRQENLVSLWGRDDRARLITALEIARRRAEPFVVEAEAETREGDTLGVEILFAPLIGPSGETDRVIGLYQPLSLTGRLRGRAIERLTIRHMAPAEGPNVPRLRLATLDGRQIA